MTYSTWTRLLLSIVLLTACTGCWDYMEYESMALVRAIGIDMDKTGKILLTYEIIQTRKKNQDGGNASQIIQGTGKTLPEAFDNIQTMVPGTCFLGYATTVIISEGAAKQQLKNILDIFFITPSIRESVFIAFTKEKPEHILRMSEGKTGIMVGEALVDYFKVTTHVGLSFPVRLREFNKMLMAEGIEPVAPLIRINGDGKLYLSDMFVFKGFKLAGILDGNETKGVGRITNQKIQELSEVTITDPDTGTPASAVFRLQDNSTKIKIKTGSEIPEVFISTKVTATMVQFDGNIGAITQEVLQACERNLEGNVKKELEAAITKAQKENSDILRIGLNFYQQHRKEWRHTFKPKWDEVFPVVPFHINVKIKILNSGTKVIPLSEQ
ncbi:Ger(x)C family spore germination protein [Paenibacillus qinlingensis]|uniref:Ger(x)C family spore germination protein n=1 Tax=Paenibacillus qinlingensis TaxID=1837343 RepID=UPI00156585F4|nr:Ger(x)C family spore germination protein [Paenibacillus qinlingensis]NQX58696.1 Ger(x)C family spore germination protein [Paenibacillus qinlingensis]